MKHQVFMISGEFGISNKIFTYFFCIDASTKIGELGELWNEAEFGVLGTQSSRDISSIPATSHFGSQQMDWTDRVGDLGMANGTSLSMFTPEPEIVDLCSPP
jgi:hypothetical protein